MTCHNFARFVGAGKDVFTIDGRPVSRHVYMESLRCNIRVDSLYTIKTRPGRFKHGAVVYLANGVES